MSSDLIIIDLTKKAKESFFYLLKKWKPILVASILAALFGIIKTWMEEPKYTAEITFVAESEKGSGIGGYASIAAQFGLDIGGGSNSAFAGENLVELLKSRLLIDKTLLSNYDNNLFIDQYIQNHKMNKNWAKDTILGKIDFKSILTKNDYNRVRDSIFNNIANGIILNKLQVDKMDKKLDIIYIRMTDNDMVFVKRFVEKLADNAINFYTDYKTRKNLANVNILQRQTDSVKSMLFGDINDVAAINDLNVNPIKQKLKTNGQKRQVDLQVNSALYTELLKNLEISKLNLRRETPLIQIIDTPKLPLKNEKKGRFLTGAIYAIITSFLVSGFLLVKRWVLNEA